jgi:hypothetical protein
MTARIDGGGLHVHAAGIDDGEHALLFPGATGAGKATIARLWRAHSRGKVLSERHNLIRLRDGEPFLCGATERNGCEPSKPGARLEAVFFLQQSTLNQTVPVSPDAAALELVARTLPDGADLDDAAGALATAERVTARVRCYRLLFRADAGAIDAVKEALA